MRPLIVTGTDTDVGKTVVAAMLMLALDGIYWKPIQSGLAGTTDTQVVAALTGLPASRFRPERFSLREPLSPHRAAELDGLTIRAADLDPPADIPAGHRLIIEGAGGVLVPINHTFLQIDLFARWGGLVVLCARTSLGTINHTLLTVEALRARTLPLLGIVFVGEAMDDSERTIIDFARTKRLGRLPILDPLNAAALAAAFESHFDQQDFAHG